MKNIDEFRLTIQKYCTAEDKYRPLIGKCISEIRSKSEEINKEKDSEYIIDTLKTGYTPPDDKQFEDMEAEGPFLIGGRKSRNAFGTIWVDLLVAVLIQTTVVWLYIIHIDLRICLDFFPLWSKNLNSFRSGRNLYAVRYVDANIPILW